MIFDALGATLGLYCAYCLLAGRVYAKRGPGGESIARDVSPVRYWTIVVIYVALAVALVAVF